MSTEKKAVDNLDLRQLAEVLVKHFDYREGFFEVSFDLRIGVGAVNANTDAEPVALPGALMAIAGIGLAKAEELKGHAVDAAKCNPLLTPKPSRKKTAA